VRTPLDWYANLARRRLARRVSRSASCVSRVCVLTVEVEEKFEPFEVTFEAAQDKLNRGILQSLSVGFYDKVCAC